MHRVVKFHGFGAPGEAAPNSMLSPDVSSPSTDIVYGWQSRNGVAWSRRTVRSPLDQVGVNVTPEGLMLTNSEVVSIGSLKFTHTTWSTATSAWLCTGFVSVTYGEVHTVSKLHGFGAKPGTRGSPVRLDPESTCTV